MSIRTAKHSGMRWANGIAAVLVAMSLAACTSAMLLSDKPSEAGLVYYLPRTLFTVTVQLKGRTITTSDGTTTTTEVRDAYVTISQISAKAVADTGRAYSLVYDGSITSNDRVCMSTSQSGLLDYVEGAADDKTGDIIVSVAKLAGRVVGQVNAFATTVAINDAVAADIDNFSIDIDPTSERDRDALVEAIKVRWKKRYPSLDTNLHFIVEGADDLADPHGSHYDSCPNNSVCYRAAVPVRVTFGGKKVGLVYSQFHTIANRRITAHIDVTRALMVEKITRLSFNDGSLSSVRISKPSEGLAVAKLPLTVVDAVLTSALAAPGNLLAQASGGVASANAANALSQAATNAANIKSLQDQLKLIRDGDLTQPSDNAKIDAALFKLACSK